MVQLLYTNKLEFGTFWCRRTNPTRWQITKTAPGVNHVEEPNTLIQKGILGKCCKGLRPQWPYTNIDHKRTLEQRIQRTKSQCSYGSICGFLQFFLFNICSSLFRMLSNAVGERLITKIERLCEVLKPQQIRCLQSYKSNSNRKYIIRHISITMKKLKEKKTY